MTLLTAHIFDCFIRVTCKVLTVLIEYFDFDRLLEASEMVWIHPLQVLSAYSVPIFIKLFQNAEAHLSSSNHSKN